MTIVVVSIAQFTPTYGNKPENLNRIEQLLESELPSTSQLVVLPEMCTTGYIFPTLDTIGDLVEPADGETFLHFQELSRRLKTAIVYGWAERDKDRLYNSASVVFADGRDAVHYRKRLLFDPDRTWARAGELAYPTWNLGPWKFGLGICMDLNDDRFIEFLRDEGVDIVTFPTNWVQEDSDHWSYWCWRLRSTEAVLLAANRSGEEFGTRFCGRSAILTSSRIWSCCRGSEDQVKSVELSGHTFTQASAE